MALSGLIKKWSEVVAVGQNLRSISSQAGQQLLNVLVTLLIGHSTMTQAPNVTLSGLIKIWHLRDT